MWEAKAAEGQSDALLAWVLEHAPEGAQVYRSADRVVVIAEAPARIDDPPAALMDRSAYGWEFDRVC
jgi:hypothetical protein